MGTEELDGFLGGGFYFCGLAEEGNTKVIVDLEGLVGVRAFAEVWDGHFGGGEGEGFDSQFHKGDTPTNESEAGQVSKCPLSFFWAFVLVLTRRDLQRSSWCP